MPQNADRTSRMPDQKLLQSRQKNPPRNRAAFKFAQHTIGLLYSCLALFASGLVALPASAAQDRSLLSGVCDDAARSAAQNAGIPDTVMLAITRTETGRAQNGKLSPWPWTVNMEGKGVWFETEDAARTYVFQHYKRGARSFDVGCFQINYRWHGDAFASIDEMFDPTANAQYAAKFLLELYAELGSWSRAAGAYHSRTEDLAEKYISRFERIRLSLSEDLSNHTTFAVVKVEPATETMPLRVRQNQFPLLKSSGPTTLGSLVPIAAKSGRSLFDNPVRAGG
jgi:hypothetical protein